VRVAELELHEIALDLCRLILEVRSGERVMCRRGSDRDKAEDAQDGGCQKRAFHGHFSCSR
jgi:hypothetical protein